MIQRLTDDPRYKTALKALQQKLKEITPENLPQELIASRRSLENLMKWHWLNDTKEDLPELLQGWRKPFGNALLNVLKTL